MNIVFIPKSSRREYKKGNDYGYNDSKIFYKKNTNHIVLCIILPLLLMIFVIMFDTIFNSKRNGK